MFLLGEPSEARIFEFLQAQRDAPFSYEDVGASRGRPVELAGYAVDHNRVRLGEGEATFDRAVAALRAWQMFDMGWIEVLPPGASVEVGTTVAVLARHHGFRSLNACRIVYLIEEDDGDVLRYGFAYGTLPGHGERGEERFTVELRRGDDTVHYDLYAFSRPDHPLAKVGHPLARRLQRRFARDSMQAMVRAVA
ncbi:MAG: DUF1990 domain-containing protein [Actinomycetota bacterium]|nr:DUF1990 domain-containing protein [Actinomycetota bacterium]